MTYFINCTFRKSRPLEKADPGPIEKAVLCQNSLYWSKHLYDKLEVADFKYDNNFLN